MWQKQNLNIGLPYSKASAFDCLAVLLLLPEIPSFLKLSLCPEAVIGFAWGSHPVWLPSVRLFWSLAIIAQQSPLKRNFICILTRTTKVGSERTEQKQELLRWPWLGLGYQEISSSLASFIFPDTRHKQLAPHHCQLEPVSLRSWAAPFWQTQQVILTRFLILKCLLRISPRAERALIPAHEELFPPLECSSTWLMPIRSFKFSLELPTLQRS